MATTDVTAVIERLLDDDYVHEQLGAAGEGLRRAYRRARRLPPQKAVQDRTVRARLRQAAAATAEAGRRAAGRRKPPPRRPRRILLALVTAAAGAVVLWAAGRDRQRRPATDIHT